MATIKAIEDRTVHQIQSGQVIVDLCSVVKELIENSLDAGANNIEVRFKNQGLDSIEVQDNGAGIAPENYDTVALKHYTSKLSTYADLSTLLTFGFRGEALSSLCALSKFTVITCLAKDKPKGTKLEFETSGKLKDTSVVAAQQGTMVSVENLFHNLPVRRRELERNIKREWNRVQGMLMQYACIQTGVKISATQINAKGKKSTLFSTKGNATTRENIANVFGAKTLTALLAMDLELQLEPTTSDPTQRWSAQEDNDNKDIHIIGHISRPAFGEGRQTPDRQMFFVNSRPCGLPQVAKAFNEVYKSYNSHQSPFIFANIIMDTHMYDVNVSPDKRTILLHEQTRMLERLKTSLIALFEIQEHTVPISQLSMQKQPSYKQLTITRSSAKSQSSMSSQIPETESTEYSRASSEDDSVLRGQVELVSEDQEIDGNESSISKYELSAGGGAGSREDISRDQAAVSLIGDWLGKKTSNRVEAKEAGTRHNRKGEERDADPTTKEKFQLIEKLSKEPVPMCRDAEFSQETEMTQSSEVTTKDLLQIPTPVSVPEVDASSPGDSQSLSPEAEDPIPAAPSPMKASSAPALRIPGSVDVRTRRTLATTATITIGDQTSTSSIGTPCPTRLRLGTPAPSISTSKISFGSRLSQRFAAPGTQDVGSMSPEGSEEGRDLPEDDVSSEVEDVDTASVMMDEDGSDEPDLDVLSDSILSIPHEGTTATDFVTDEERQTIEDAKVAKLIQTAEENIKRPEDIAKMTKFLVKGGLRKKTHTVQLALPIETSISKIAAQIKSLDAALSSFENTNVVHDESTEGLDAGDAEEKLSLTINKSDFKDMRIIGQFNLGFILASRTYNSTTNDKPAGSGDNLFIIDQHASDEKYNFERLQASTIVQSQRLVLPKTLDLNAMEEEVVMENLDALEHNGFLMHIDDSGAVPVGQRCQLISLPLSKETTFGLKDLEELISMLADNPMGSAPTENSQHPEATQRLKYVPRPSKVRKMFAMRACRSSIMIGTSLTKKRMGEVVRHMGEIDKPWNCPHGRPTMRHLCGLGAWDQVGWKEGTWVEGITAADTGEDADGEETAEAVERDSVTDWAGYIRAGK